MRILFTFVAGTGHFEPLIPIARAAERAGHTVAFCSRSEMIPQVQSAGFTGIASGEVSGDPTKKLPLLEPNANREDRVLREKFARDTARQRAKDIISICADWQPDLVVCDEIDFGSMIAAERLQMPYAVVLVVASGSFVRKSVVGESLDEVRAENGLPADPNLDMLSRYLVLSPFPPSYRDPAFPLLPTAHSIRTGMDEMQGDLPLLRRLRKMETVYFTLGTVFDRESGDLFSRVISGLQELPINLIVTIGNYLDPADFGPQPPNVFIERYIPQSLILPHCDVVVSHGGSGSVMGALKYGLPSVLLPIGADQPLNADRCHALGAAITLDVVSATPEDIRNAVSSVLADSAYRRAAECLRDEIAALPGPEYALSLLERLAVEKRPRYSELS